MLLQQKEKQCSCICCHYMSFHAVIVSLSHSLVMYTEDKARLTCVVVMEVSFTLVMFTL